MIKIVNNYLNIDKYKEIKKIVSYTPNIESKINNSFTISKKLHHIKQNFEKVDIKNQLLNDIEKLINKIHYIKNNNQTIKNIIENINKRYLNINNFLNNNSSSIKFLLIGPSNSGKSLLLNNIIGYSKNLLPLNNFFKNLGTDVGIIIKYSEKNEEVKLYEIPFHTNDIGNNNYFEYNKMSMEAKGTNEIYVELKRLNHSKKSKFYLIKTPIELLDKMNLSKEIKEKIELIDFPG